MFRAQAHDMHGLYLLSSAVQDTYPGTDRELTAEADLFALIELAERRREIAHALDAAERVLGISGAQ